MKGIVLAGGNGTRLFPSSKAISKQLLPVYDKPAIYYPMSVLMLAGIQDILIISTPRDVPLIESLLGDGSQFGLKLSYAVQEVPRGIADAFIVGKEFINGEACAMILGDNLFYGKDLPKLAKDASGKSGATVFAYHVPQPQAFGVVEFDKNKRVISIEEKPQVPKSNWAVTGLYFYDERVVEFAESLKPSARGELEITDLNRLYLEKEELNVELLGRGFAWLDMGTSDSLLESAQFVQTLEHRQGLKIACLEEIALHKNYVSREELRKLTIDYPESSYGSYVKKMVNSTDVIFS